MSDYNEHLISQAGGDGFDPLPDILARLANDRDDFAEGYTDQSIRDREHLLGMIRDRDARLAAALDLANTSGRCGWRISADQLRKVLRTK